MTLRPLLLALAVVLSLSSSTAMATTVRTVLSIGNDVGLDSEPPLRWAETDAQRLRDVLVELGGVMPARATLLQGPSVEVVAAELLRIRGQVEEVKRRGERAELFVTFSGHGDDEALHLRGERLPWRRLDALLKTIPADAVVVIVDACRTGPVRSGRNRGAHRGPAFDVTLVKDTAPTGRVLIASASSGEVAQESDDIEGAWFTHHVTAGLRGAADGDGNGDVTLAELYRHAHARTVAESFGGVAVQHPQLVVDLQGEGELSLTRLDRAAASLVLDAGLAGSFLVVDDRRGDVIFEVEKSAGRPLTLAVPPRRLRVHHRQGSLQRLATADVGRGQRLTLGDDAFVVVNRVAARGRGADVDPTPFMGQLAITAGSGAAAARWTTGLLVGVERRIADTPLFVGVTGAGAAGDGADTLRDFHEREGRVWAHLAGELWTPVGRLELAGGPGVNVLVQDVTRRDAARLAAAGLQAATAATGMSVGPLAVVSLSAHVPIGVGIGVVAGVIGHGATVLVDGEADTRFGIDGYAGVGFEW